MSLDHSQSSYTFIPAQDQSKWDQYLTGFPLMFPYNYYSWRTVLEESYGIQSHYYLVENEQKQLCGVLPFYIAKTVKGKPQLYGMRYGLIGNDNQVRMAQLRFIQDYVQENRVIHYTVPAGLEAVNDSALSQVKHTLMIPLRENQEETWNSLRDKTRNMIRKGEKAGLSIEAGSHNTGEFYMIYAAYMKSLGVFFHSQKFFDSVLKHLQHNAELICAKLGNEVIGGTLLLYGTNVACYPYQAVKVEHRNLAPVQFMNWDMMKRCHARGMQWLDMGESKVDSPVYQSKINFGANPYELHYYTSDCTSINGDASAEPEQDVENSAKSPLSPLSIINWVHQHSPLWFTKRFSPWMRKTGRII